MKQEWQPILTAPRDGTRFLVHKQCHGQHELAVAWFDQNDPDMWQVMDLPDLTTHKSHLCGAPDCVDVFWTPYPQSPAASLPH